MRKQLTKHAKVLISPKILAVRHSKSIASWLLLAALLAGLFTGCSSEDLSDAYGQFEATETSIAAEATGKLLQFTIEEGDKLSIDQQVGYIDTTKMVLQREELKAKLESIQAQIPIINAQVEVQKSELNQAETDLKRTESLIRDQAATQKQLDDSRARVRTIKKQIDAQQIQKKAVRAEIKATQARIKRLNEQISDAVIINPVDGTVITSFVEPHEVMRMGQPLYRITNLDTLELRVYVSGAQLPNVTLNQQVQVLVDKNAKENRELNGRVSWIASKAEFTPQQIQTKEERVTQVYAVKVKVPNSSGILKDGMPGEVNFNL